MKLEDLHKLWDKEQELDFSQPDKIIRETPLAHGRWWKFYTDEKQRYLTIKQEHDKLRLLKYEWYIGRMSDSERISLKWAIQPLKLLKTEVDDYLATDAELAPLATRVELQLLKLKFIEDGIKSINNRNFLLKNYLEWLRFSNGS